MNQPTPHGGAIPEPQIVAPRSRFYQGPFGRLFRNLEPFQPPGQTGEEKETWLQSVASKMVESDDVDYDNDTIPAGYTYFGQFVDHDITFDPASSLQRSNDPNRLHNFRTPRFDLDNLYGRGPKDNPFMYDGDPDNYRRSCNVGTKLLVEKGEGPDEDDLPRNSQGRALIGDMRNDENIIVSQLQLAFIKFHNKVVDHLERRTDLCSDVLLHEAQRLVRWHYQWVVIHDYLKRIAGHRLVDSLLPAQPDSPEDCPPREPRLCYYGYKHQPFIPVEFSVAAYRFGHSMVRPTYQLNKVTGSPPDKLPIFDATADAEARTHCGGFRPLPPQFTVQWDLFLNIDGSNPQKSRLIDTKLASPLGVLPDNVDAERRSLAFLNLMRGWRMDLPSGQYVAQAMAVWPHEDIGLHDGGQEPLWYYILREAEEKRDGERLGFVGARIVGEVFVGLLAGDPFSYLNVHPRWEPEFPKLGSTFELRDILRFAEVPLTEDDLHF